MAGVGIQKTHLHQQVFGIAEHALQVLPLAGFSQGGRAQGLGGLLAGVLVQFMQHHGHGMGEVEGAVGRARAKAE